MSTNQPTRTFKPALPSTWFLSLAQLYARCNLSLSNPLAIDQSSLALLSQIPREAGIILTSNHADETDPQIMLELSRRTGKRFIAMCNREAFDELLGMSGWALQRMGLFSVERGAHDAPAKQYAIDTLKSGETCLVIFPEGEIYYMNEVVQQFHTGAAEIGLQALLHHRRQDPDWTCYVVPMGIKYHYTEPIESILGQRLSRLEKALSLPAQENLGQRLRAVQAKLLQAEVAHHQVQLDEPGQNLTQAIHLAQDAMLNKLEEKYDNSPRANTMPIDESWKIGAEIRKDLEQAHDPELKRQLEKDLSTAEEVAQLSSWDPHYYSDGTSPDRMAEALLKLEREYFRRKRPKQLARRTAFVKLAAPIDLAQFADGYLADGHSTRQSVTDQLRQEIQALVDSLHGTQVP